jgi:hypothetical protein
MNVITSCITYLAVSAIATIWVGRTLYHNGRVFLVDAFHGNTDLADSVNHLLVVGFYLVNAGYVALALRTSDSLATPRQAMEVISEKIGVVLLVLGAMHFFNLVTLNYLRKRGTARHYRHIINPGWGPEGTPMGKVLP